MNVHRLTKAQARRIAVRAQLLEASRPTDLLTVVQQLTFLQIDPTAAIAPSADLVAWSRLGSAYQPAHLRQALEQDRTLFEHDALVRPMSDLGLYLAGAADWPTELVDNAAHLFVKAAEPHRSEIHIPQPVINFFEANLELGEQVAHIHPARVPPDAAIATDQPTLVVPWIDERLQCRAVGTR